MRGALQGEDRIPFVRAVEARCQALSPEPYLELSYMSRAFRHCLAHASSHCGGPPDTSLALQRQHECKLQLRSLLANCWADKLALNGDGMTGCPVADPRCWTGHNTCAKLVLTHVTDRGRHLQQHTASALSWHDRYQTDSSWRRHMRILAHEDVSRIAQQVWYAKARKSAFLDSAK